MSSVAQSDQPLRRRWQFSLLRLFGAVAVIGAGLAAFNLFVVRSWRDDAVRELVDAVQRQDHAQIEAAVAEVRRLRAGDQAAAQVAPLLAGTDWTLKLHAAQAMAGLGAVAVPQLVHQVERQVAVERPLFHDLTAYRRCVQTTEAISRLCKAAQNHPDGAVRAALIQLLSIGDAWRPADSPLGTAAGSGPDAAAASPAPSALEAAAPSLRETFLAALADVDPRVREAAARALSGSCAGSPSAADSWDALVEALKDEDLSVQIAAASALATSTGGVPPSRCRRSWPRSIRPTRSIGLQPLGRCKRLIPAGSRMSGRRCARACAPTTAIFPSVR
jgi:HEAT repeat protein